MSSQVEATESMLAEAFTNPSSRGAVLQRCTAYLELLARCHFDQRIQRRVSMSDIVQDTLLEAHRDFPNFRGETMPQLLAWLRQVLVHNLAEAVDGHLGAEKRDVRRECSMENLASSIEGSAQGLADLLADPGRSPSGEAIQREEVLVLADALSELPRDYYEVIVGRHLEGLSFRDVARRMDRSEGAVRMLWFRAIDRLRTVLGRKGLV